MSSTAGDLRNLTPLVLMSALTHAGTAVYEPQQLLPGLTRGEGVLESAFVRHRQVTGPAPARHRTDRDPLHRAEYLARITRGGVCRA